MTNQRWAKLVLEQLRAAGLRWNTRIEVVDLGLITEWMPGGKECRQAYVTMLMEADPARAHMTVRAWAINLRRLANG